MIRYHSVYSAQCEILTNAVLDPRAQLQDYRHTQFGCAKRSRRLEVDIDPTSSHDSRHLRIYIVHGLALYELP